jgi:hypothetical protein
MSDARPIAAADRDEPLLDTFLREAVPEIKLALGDMIDRDNLRAIPDRYAKLLPESVLVVSLRPDAAEAVSPIAAELEGEFTDSCMRHGSLYDREYRVKLRVANAPGAPLFRVMVRKADEPEPEPLPPPRRPEPPARHETPAPSFSPIPGPSLAETIHVAPAASEGATVAAPRPAAPAPSPSSIDDPDATRLDGIAPPPPAPREEPVVAGPRWDNGRWTLVVEDEEGNERERFPVPGPMTTVGRQTDKSEQRSDLQVADAPHVSRRQLALVWAPRGERPGFTVYNVGLNALHVGDREVAGANRGKGELRLEELMADHTEWVGPGTTMRIGEHGPILRLLDTREGAGEDAPAADEVEIDPDATRFG